MPSGPPPEEPRDIRFRDANVDRVIAVSTAETHPAGTFYFTDYEIAVLSVGYSISDRVQLTLTGLPPTFEDAPYFVDLANDGFGPALGFTLQGEDMAGWHSYTLRATVGLERGNVNAELNYAYRRTPIEFDIRLFRREAPRGGLTIGGQSQE